MNKLILLLSVFFMTLVLSEFNHKFQNNLRLINYSFVTPNVVNRTEIRPRRWIKADSEVHHVSVGSWILRTRLNHHLKIPANSTISWVVFTDSTSPFYPFNDEHCEARFGDVVGSKQSSIAVMTICRDNFYIWFQLGEKNFAVQPTVNGTHILEEIKFLNQSEAMNTRFRRESHPIDGKFYNLTGDTVDLVDQDGPTNVEEKPEYNKQWENLLSDRMWIKSEFAHETREKSSTPPRWLELGIAVDYSVIDFHGERVQQYVFALLNIVSAIYKDASLGADLTLVISRIIFYVEKKDGMVQHGNARKSLENVNKWNRKILSSSNKAHDVAVWLTRLDIGGPSGYAPVSGACDPARSCALNRDEGLTSAFIIAHELAHILGLTHDGDEAANNSCGREALAGSVMAPMVAATFHRFHWSSCSKNEFHQRSKKWICLNNSPDIDNNSTEFKGIPHHAFTMDEQCRMEFGEGYELCRSFELPGLCSHLWCGHRNTHQVCKTKKGPPLEGTACGSDKWCINGSCEPIDRSVFQLDPLVNKPSDGQWSEWTSWTKCSTTCGIGIRRRERQCHGFTANTENNCLGSSKSFAICQQSPCHPAIDPRREQCARLLSLIGMKRSSRRQRVTWWPHELEGAKCRLVCRNVENGRIFVGSDFVPDGTTCSYDSTDICIEGKCHSVGCDYLLNSTIHRDACGVCAGDNSTCISISNKFQRKIRRANVRIAKVPSTAFDIVVEIEVIPPFKGPGTKLVIRDARRRKFHAEIPESHRGNRSLLVVEDTAFRMEKIHDVYKISGRGPTSSELIISLKIPSLEVKRGLTVFVNFRYMTNRGEDNKTNTYSWVTGGWSPCSVTCGGGFRHRTAACKNDQTGQIEHRKKCKSLTKPLQQVEKCNTFSCQFKWIPGPWEGCSKTCGTQGSQQRQIYCVHSTFPDNQLTRKNEKIVYRVMLPPNICKNHRLPQTQRGCNRIPCRGNWVFTNWSDCTRTCGGGLQSRMARCVSLEDESFFDCEGTTMQDELRPCRGRGSRHSRCEPLCKRDRSRYCAVASLKKYCRIPGFRRQCCRACQPDD